MREFWKSIPGEMFDFPGYYQKIANGLPNNCRICEVGNADGKSAIFLAESLANIGKQFLLTMVDSLDYGNLGQLTEIMRNVTRCGLAESIELLPISSVDAAAKFPNELFHFVFIDASHDYEQTKSDIRAWWPKIMPRYHLAGHDAISHEHVKMAIHEVIDEKFLQIEPTDLGYGVWQLQNANGAYIN
jgi:predicted O-methyltransferase YrrM